MAKSNFGSDPVWNAKCARVIEMYEKCGLTAEDAYAKGSLITKRHAEGLAAADTMATIGLVMGIGFGIGSIILRKMANDDLTADVKAENEYLNRAYRTKMLNDRLKLLEQAKQEEEEAEEEPEDTGDDREENNE